MVENLSRASSSTAEAFWNNSFQPSTGYTDWPFMEHFKSVAKLLAVIFVALKKRCVTKEINSSSDIMRMLIGLVK